MFGLDFKKISMKNVITASKVKTKTAIAVALVVLAAGSVMAGMYYLPKRNVSFSDLFGKKTPLVAENENKNASIQTNYQIGKVLGTCQVCGGKTYCKCDCPDKKTQ
jgi:hypothetical protein